LGASDIHIENQRESIRIRMRVDGALHTVAELSRDRYRVIMATLASRANISTASREPQSGHMQQEIHRDGASHVLNLRVEAVMTVYGLDLVLRLFNFDESMLNLDLLSISKKEREQIDEVISHPRGMLLMVGPTGSGKSTTLYSILNALNTQDRKIITLEDPVENTIPGIAQIPIDTTNGQRFADGLRSVLRLDPDVVMVGEIRDNETAKTAIQASITGHLVLSSFHANSTAAAFSRMIDMIGQNPIFSSAVRLVIAQRLVRRLWDDSKEEYEPDEATRKWVKEVLKDLPENVDCPDLDTFKLWRAVPTDDVPFGYKGRIPVMEQLVVSENIQKFLRGDVEDVHTEAIEKAGYTGKVSLALDVASSEFYKEGMYDLAGEGKKLTADELVALYQDWCEKYPIISIEDGMAEDDFEGWKKLTDALGEKIMLVGDDLFVTNTERLSKGIKLGCGNSILIKLNQIGSVSETLEAFKMAHKAGYTAISSHRSGETEDTTIADLAVALNTCQIKTGAPSRSERVAKYNQLLRIEEELGGAAFYPGFGAFNRK